MMNPSSAGLAKNSVMKPNLATPARMKKTPTMIAKAVVREMYSPTPAGASGSNKGCGEYGSGASEESVEDSRRQASVKPGLRGYSGD